MNRITSILISFFLAFTFAYAQPKFTSKVQKAIFSVNTYDKDGNLLSQGVGFYVGNNGEAVADYRIFKGAYKATITEGGGKQADVDCILGADDTYSMVRFRVNTKGNAVLTSASSIQPIGTTFHVVGNANAGSTATGLATIADTALIQGKYAYYGLNKQVDTKLVGAPVFNDAGNLVGILHAPMGEKSYVLDIRFREGLKMEAIHEVGTYQP